MEVEMKKGTRVLERRVGENRQLRYSTTRRRRFGGEVMRKNAKILLPPAPSIKMEVECDTPSAILTSIHCCCSFPFQHLLAQTTRKIYRLSFPRLLPARCVPSRRFTERNSSPDSPGRGDDDPDATVDMKEEEKEGEDKEAKKKQSYEAKKARLEERYQLDKVRFSVFDVQYDSTRPLIY